MTDMTPLKAFLTDNHMGFREDATGAECTTFRIGGPIALLAEPKTVSEAAALLSYADDNAVPYFIIGNGSNLLIPDEGLDIMLIRLSGKLACFSVEGTNLVCGAGASMAAASKCSVLSGLMGLEWAAGIPGTVGGAVAMNAGAYGGEIKQVLSRVTVYHNGQTVTIAADPDAMGYRHSAYSYPEMIVLGAEFGLFPDDGTAKARMDDLSARRREKQPLSYPSAGSTFKRPKGYYAGALIEGAGLKGFTVGGAAVSEKHAGFVINLGGATYSDVVTLIETVQRVVFEKYGVRLEPEVKIL